MKEIKTFAIVFLFSLGIMITSVNCNAPKDKNDMGQVETLPKGNYIIWNTGSRHIVKCVKDSIRESIRFQINMLMEHGLEFNVKENSTLEKVLKKIDFPK